MPDKPGSLLEGCEHPFLSLISREPVGPMNIIEFKYRYNRNINSTNASAPIKGYNVHTL